ncbi:acetyl-CoA acetyltransferase [Fodinicurvata sediminis]|uniref:acetyl-CoA acetyltransferase n=1 Tax=Fodinicurvata sediminis TaxID=1121832 RepID=UPI0003B54396|nr:acetyl-CoA acetyltransferase [Fodinicurvata sediminis]
MKPAIVGWGHTPFGAHKDQDLEDLIRSAAREALESAGVSGADVDGIWLGHFNAGMVDEAFPASLVLAADEGLRFTPATRCENACASGSAAIYSALNAIQSGVARIALVVGVEKMTHLDTPGVTQALARASYQREEAGQSFPQIFANLARQYAQRFGDPSEALARIAVKNHANALSNPLAQLQKELSFEFCNRVSEKNPMIAEPLRMTDCSLISDGAAALVIAQPEVAADFKRAIAFRATAQVSDFLPMSRREMTELPGPRRAFQSAFDRAGIQVHDLDFAEVHDCFTIAELMIYEAMGLAEPGQGARLLEEGQVLKGGRLPVNLSGGLKAKGHPVGATGVSMHVLAARQLAGAAGEMQVPGAELGAVFNMGGSGVANYCSVLEARR